MRKNKGQLIGNERFPQNQAVQSAFAASKEEAPQVPRQGLEAPALSPFPAAAECSGLGWIHPRAPLVSPARKSRTLAIFASAAAVIPPPFGASLGRVLRAGFL